MLPDPDEELRKKTEATSRKREVADYRRAQSEPDKTLHKLKVQQRASRTTPMTKPPSGPRHKCTIAAAVSSGVQPTLQGSPQLIPDFFTPDAHISGADDLSSCCSSFVSAPCQSQGSG